MLLRFLRLQQYNRDPSSHAGLMFFIKTQRRASTLESGAEVFEKRGGQRSFFEPDRYRTIVMDFHQHMCTELTRLSWDAFLAQQVDELIY